MSFTARHTPEAVADLRRLYATLPEENNHTAEIDLQRSIEATTLLESFAYSCRKAAADDPYLRE